MIILCNPTNYRYFALYYLVLYNFFYILYTCKISTFKKYNVYILKSDVSHDKLKLYDTW